MNRPSVFFRTDVDPVGRDDPARRKFIAYFRYTRRGGALLRPSPAGRNPRPCHSERSEESLPRPSRFPPRGIAAVVGTKNMPPACFLNVPTQAVVGFSIAHVSAETCLPALRADAISRGQQRVSPLITPSCLDRLRRGGALLRPSPAGRNPRPCHSERSEESLPRVSRATSRVAPTYVAASPPPHSRYTRRGGALLRPSLASLVKGRGTARRRWWDSPPSLTNRSESSSQP
jgi:hypothetical protein